MATTNLQIRNYVAFEPLELDLVWLLEVQGQIPKRDRGVYATAIDSGFVSAAKQRLRRPFL